MNNKGFSLTELLVVVTIIGVLSAVAIPSYKIYIARAKLNSIIEPAYNAIKAKTMEYYSKTGEFPAASDLGLSTSGYIVTNPTEFGQGIARVDIARNVTTCNRPVQVIAIVVPGENVGLTFTDQWDYLPSTNNALVYTHQIYEDNSALIDQCGTQANVVADYQYLPAECGYGAEGPLGGFFDC